jgi:hypothetical protein
MGPDLRPAAPSPAMVPGRALEEEEPALDVGLSPEPVATMAPPPSPTADVVSVEQWQEEKAPESTGDKWITNVGLAEYKDLILDLLSGDDESLDEAEVDDVEAERVETQPSEPSPSVGPSLAMSKSQPEVQEEEAKLEVKRPESDLAEDVEVEVEVDDEVSPTPSAPPPSVSLSKDERVQEAMDVAIATAKAEIRKIGKVPRGPSGKYLRRLKRPLVRSLKEIVQSRQRAAVRQGVFHKFIAESEEVGSNLAAITVEQREREAKELAADQEKAAEARALLSQLGKSGGNSVLMAKRATARANLREALDHRERLTKGSQLRTSYAEGRFALPEQYREELKGLTDMHGGQDFHRDDFERVLSQVAAYDEGKRHNDRGRDLASLQDIEDAIDWAHARAEKNERLRSKSTREGQLAWLSQMEAMVLRERERVALAKYEPAEEKGRPEWHNDEKGMAPVQPEAVDKALSAIVSALGYEKTPEQLANLRGKYGERDNPTEITSSDVVGYAPLATSLLTTTVSQSVNAFNKGSKASGEGIVEGLSADVKESSLTGLTEANLGTGLTADTLGAADAMLRAFQAGKRVRDQNLSLTDQVQNFGEANSAVAEALKSGSSAAEKLATLIEAGGPAAVTAALIAGGGSVAMGAIDVIRGAGGFIKARHRQEILEGLAKDAKESGVREAAAVAALAQSNRQKDSLALTVKGTVLVVGGALLLLSNPVGWLLLGAASLIGGVAFIVGFFRKRTQKRQLAEREFGVAAERKAWQDRRAMIEGSDMPRMEKTVRLEQEGPDPLQRELSARSYQDVGDFYSQYMLATAKFLYDNGVAGESAEVREMLEGMGLNVDPANETPNIAAIVKKLQNG